MFNHCTDVTYQTSNFLMGGVQLLQNCLHEDGSSEVFMLPSPSADCSLASLIAMDLESKDVTVFILSLHERRLGLSHLGRSTA